MTPETLDSTLDRLRRMARRGVVAGMAGSVALAVVWATCDGGFAAGCLAAFLLWSGVPLGMAALLVLHHLVGGVWGSTIRPLMVACLAGLMLLPLFFIPVFLNLPVLYGWADPALVASSEILQHQSVYLNRSGFLVRAIIFFAVWLGGGALLAAASLRARTARAPLIASPGALLYAFTVSFAGIDWIASLQSEWYSSMIGFYLMAGQVVTAMAVALLFASRMPAALGEPKAASRAADDLGKLLLTAIILHAYIAYAQFFIIWNGDLPGEISWYAPRMHGPWGVAAVVLVAIHFALPGAALLSRATRRRAAAAAAIASVVLSARVLDAAWMVLPSSAAGAGGILAYAAAAVAMGGFMVALIAAACGRILGREPVVNGDDESTRAAGEAT